MIITTLKKVDWNEEFWDSDEQVNVQLVEDRPKPPDYPVLELW